MIRLALPNKGSAQLNVLCLGAHSDDIEIGCGGTLLYLKRTYPNIKLNWIVFSATGVRRNEAEKSAILFTDGSEKQIILKEFRDGFFPYSEEIKAFFEELKSQIEPDVVFTHRKDDAHQDHRVVSDLTWNTFRNHLVLEYEIPKYDGDLGRPNVFVPLEESFYETKLSHLFAAFNSQLSKRWFQRETFLGLMRLRGMECNSASGYAEGFYARKVVL